MENTMYAGYCKLAVTPPLGLKIPGYFQIRIADGVETELYLRAVAFSQGEKKALIITCDAASMEPDAARELKKSIAKRCDMDEGAIYLHCVHSHTAFRVVMPEEQEEVFADYLRLLFRKFADCAQAAFEDLKPCTVKYAKGAAEGIAFIRSYIMKDGSVRTNPGIGNPDVVRPLAQQDASVQLVRILREEGKELLLTNFGTHADMIGGTRYCHDWPGYLCEILENAFAGNVEAVTLVGYEGNSNHVNVFQRKGTPHKGVEKAKGLARGIAGEVLKLYDRAADTQREGIAWAEAEAVIGKNTYDPADVPEAKKIKQLYQKLGTNQDPVFATFKLKVNEAIRIVNNLSRPEFFHIPVFGLRIGGIGFVGMPCEPFQSVGIAVKEASSLEMTVTSCLTNGSHGYFPDEQAFAIPGSYEQGSSPYAPDCAEKLTQAAREVLQQLEA